MSGWQSQLSHCPVSQGMYWCIKLDLCSCPFSCAGKGREGRGFFFKGPKQLSILFVFKIILLNDSFAQGTPCPFGLRKVPAWLQSIVQGQKCISWSLENLSKVPIWIFSRMFLGRTEW